MSQRALAAAIGVHTTHLCGVERGRRRIGQPDFLGRFALALGLAERDLGDLQWAQAHDQVIERVQAAGLTEPELRLVSLALELGHEMSADERDGLERQMKTALQSKRVLRTYTAGANPQREGQP